MLAYFSVSDDERIKRLKQRPSVHHQALIENPQLIEIREKAYQKCYAEFNGKKAVIDTNGMPIGVSSRMLALFAKKEH
ncbi:MAG: hypothetical protein QME12_01655 [Nanoarchaeota archaeon]|nr:hypothetical protein [Nanoarchaeota archaeon]